MGKIIQFPIAYQTALPVSKEKSVHKSYTKVKTLDDSPVTKERVVATRLFYHGTDRGRRYFLLAAPYKLEGRGIIKNKYWDREIDNEMWYGYEVTECALQRLAKKYPLIRTSYDIAIEVEKEASTNGYNRMGITGKDVDKFYISCCSN